MAGNSTEPGRSVTSKVVAILLTFHDGGEHSLTEIARLTSLPISTTHRLVTELAGWGVLERTDESQFRAGSPIRAIGGRAAYSPAIVESARRVLEDLVSAARTSAGLGVLTGAQVAYIEKRNDHSPVTTFAHNIRIDRPHDDYRLDLQVSKIILNSDLPADRFKLDQPSGSELVHVGENEGPKQP